MSFWNEMLQRLMFYSNNYYYTHFFSVQPKCVRPHGSECNPVSMGKNTAVSLCFQSNTGIKNSFILMPKLIHLPGHAGPPTKKNKYKKKKICTSKSV